MNRRQILFGSVAALAARSGPAQTRTQPATDGVLPIEQFQPKSMLHAHETKVARSRYPVIDFHTHITRAPGLSGVGKLSFSGTPEECLAVMDRKNIRTMVNLTSGYGDNLREAVAKLATAHPGRFVVFTEPAWSKTAAPHYPKVQADLI